MKKTTYFGNRFKAVVRGFRPGRSSKQLAVASTPAASEFEALESRILLSGIGTGLNKKQVTFIDADGDKVTVKALGKGAKFNIDLGGSTNNADIANIEIGRDGTSIGISVAPVGSFTKPTQTKAFINPNWNLGDLASNDNGNAIGNLSLDKLTATNQKIQTQYYNLTPGYTNVGSITAADGITEVGSIGLTAAVVPVIDLPGVAVGNINLSTGQVSKVDAFMATNGSYLNNYGGWTPGIHNINIYDINAGSIAGINIAGIDPDLYNGYEPTANFEGNNYLGVITTDDGGIGRLTGTNSMFMGQLSLGGEDAFLGNIVLKGWAEGSIIAAEGDLTFNAKNFNGVIEVGGHLNLGLQGANGGTFIAGEGISGLRSSTTDSIIVSNLFNGDLVAKGGDIAGLTIGGTGNITGAVIDSANAIGAIWSSSGIDGALILAGTDLKSITLRGVDLGVDAQIFVGNELGSIDIAGGSMLATINATTFVEVLVRGGDLNGTLLAKDGIGDVTIIGGTLNGSLIAQGEAGIGEIDVTNLAGGLAIGANAVIYSAGDIAGISAATTGGTAIGNASIQAVGTIGFFDVNAYGGGAGDAAMDGLTLIAPTIDNITVTSIAGIAISGSTFISTSGNVGNITATGLNGGFAGTPSQIVSAGSVGNVTGTAIKAGPGIGNLTITAQTDIENVTGSSLEGDGIAGGAFTSVTGNIGNITGTSSSPAGAGNGISGLDVKAIAGTVGNVTGTAAGDGNGLNNVGVQADKGIGTISGSSFTGNGISAGNYLAINGDITAVTATTSEGTAISGGATFESIGGQIKSITATPTGVDGRAVDGANFTAASFGDLTFAVSNLAGGFAVNNLNVTATGGTAGNGNVGAITVTNASLAANADGLTGSTIEATGNIGQITVSVAGQNATAIGGLNLLADSEGDETGDILGVTATSKQGDAIDGTNFTGANVGPITATVTALNGGNAISNLNVTSLVGKIDAITASTNSNTGGAGILFTNLTSETDIVSVTATANTGNAMDNVTATANTGNIGDLTATSTDGTAILDSNFAATEGDIANIKATSETGNGIVNSFFTGENVGNKIEATVTGDGGDAILASGITATKGDVSDIVASTASESGGAAIAGLNVSATNDIKSITATANVGDAIRGITAIADSDSDDAGNLGNVTATTVEGSALTSFGGTLRGASVGDITATVTGAKNGTELAVDGMIFTSTVGNIGKITAKVQGDGFDAIVNLSVTAAGDVGDITASTASQSGGRAINGSIITAANVNAITADVTDENGSVAIDNLQVTANGTNADETISNGKIGAITVTSASANSNGINQLFLDAGIGVDGQAIGNITVALTKSTGFAVANSVFDATTDPAAKGPTAAADQKATIGSLTTTGDNAGLDNVTLLAPVSIGAITSSGTDDQSVNLDAPTSGALTFNGLANGKTVTVDASANVTSLGAITVEAPGGTPANTANLTLTGATAVESLGAVAVDGVLTLPALGTLKTASTINALTVQGGATVGTGAAGSSVGLITIGDGSAAANNVTFTFATMNGKTNATADTTLAVDFLLGAGPDITTLAAKSPGTTSAGVTAILV